MNNFCQNCGKSLQPKDVFCASCGTRIGAVEDQDKPVETQQAEATQEEMTKAFEKNIALENLNPELRANNSQEQAENSAEIYPNQDFTQQFTQTPAQPSSKNKTILVWAITLIAVLVIVVAGNYYFFNNVFAQPEKNTMVGTKDKTSQGAAKNSSQAKDSSKNAASSSNENTKDKWNSDKESELKSFLDSWAPTMNQTYTKSTKSDMSLGGEQYYGDFGNKINIGWSDSKNGPHDYNVVSVYNYNKQGSQSGRPGEYHITYAFSYHDGQPVALVSENTNGGYVWKPTRNPDVAENWQRIASE